MRVGPTMPQGNSRRSWRMTQTPNRPQQGQPGSQGCARAGGAVSARADEHIHGPGMQPPEQMHPFLTQVKRRISITHIQDFPEGPVAKTLHSQRRGPRVRSLVREVDPTFRN